MTKKRFKFGLMALGALAAFFLALIALFLAPASADKSSAKDHHKRADNFQGAGGAPDPIYFEHSNWSGFGGGHASGGFGGPCTGASCGGDKPGGQNSGGDDTTGDSGQSGSNGSENGSGNGSGNGAGQNPPGNGFGPNFGSGFSGGGNGGSSGGGNGGSSGNGNGGPWGQSGPNAPGQPDAGQGPDGHNGPGSDSPILTLNDKPGDPPFTPDLPPPFEGPPNCDCAPPPGGSDVPPGITDGVTHQVPEPLTMSLFAVGLAGCASIRRRRKGQ